MTTKWVPAHRRWNPLLHSLFLLSLLSAVLATSSQESNSLEQKTKTNKQVEQEVDKRSSLSYASMDSFGPLDSYAYAYLPTSPDEEIIESLRPNKRGMEDGQMPGVLRFGKRAQSFIRFGRSAADYMDDGIQMLSKKEMPGVLRFGKRRVEGQQEKKAVPGVLRFGKRDSDIPGVLRFGKRDSDMPGVLRFGKRDSDMPGVLRFGKRYAENNYLPAGVLRFGKRGDMPGVLRFGKKSDMPGVLRFGKRSGDMPGVLRFGKRSDMPGVLRFG